MLDRNISCGNRCRQGDVHRTSRNRRGAFEIEHHAITCDLKRHFDRQRDIGNPVIVEEIRGLPSPVRQAVQLGAHEGFGPVRQSIQRGPDRVGPILRQQVIHALHTQIQRAQLAVQITLGRLRQAGVPQKDVDDVLLDHPCPCQLDWGQHEGFLEGFGRGRVVVARHRPTDIVPVANTGEIAKHFAVMVVGPHKTHVRQVCAAHMRIIEDVDIAILQIAIGRGLVDHGLHGERHHAHENRQA